jgi:hypothetical protein
MAGAAGGRDSRGKGNAGRDQGEGSGWMIQGGFPTIATPAPGGGGGGGGGAARNGKSTSD